MLDLFDRPTLFGCDRLADLPARLFDPEPFFGDRFEAGFAMRVEQFRDGEDLVIRVELPGIDPDADVEIAIEDRQLSIDATREDKTETTEDGRSSELRYGRFHRSMTLPMGADADAVKATYRDGILEVSVPIREDIEHKTKVVVSHG